MSGLEPTHPLMQPGSITLDQYNSLSTRLKFWFVHRLNIDTTGLRHITEYMIERVHVQISCMKRRYGMPEQHMIEYRYRSRTVPHKTLGVVNISQICMWNFASHIMVLQHILVIMDMILELLMRLDRGYDKKIETYEYVLANIEHVHALERYNDNEDYVDDEEDNDEDDCIDALDRIMMREIEAYERLYDVNIQDYATPTIRQINSVLFKYLTKD